MYIATICLVIISTTRLVNSHERVPNAAGIKERDIKIYYFDQENPKGILVNVTNSSDVSRTTFIPTKDTIIYIHGWMDDVNARCSHVMRDSVLNNTFTNFFLVDWGWISKNAIYPMVVARLEIVGTIVSVLIKDLVTLSGLNLGTTTIVGHSLGAHVSGIAGRALDGVVSQLVGLDPAGPAFSESKVSNRLDSHSAQFVQAIHTSASLLGFKQSLGHADYYPNDGLNQPACGIDIACSHLKAVDYYGESLEKGHIFKAYQCNKTDYEKDMCEGKRRSWMAGYYLDKSASGIYYVKTNNKAPFADVE